MNRANANRWSALVAFFKRRLAGERKRRVDNPYGHLTARQETVVEVGELWGLSTGALRSELNAAVFLEDRLPRVWALVADGSLDRFRAKMISDALRREVDETTPLEAVDGRISKYLLKHRRALDDGDALVCCTTRQLQNKLAYETRKLRSDDAEERFRQRYADRRTSAQAGEDGMGWLTIEHSTDRVELAQHRLTLAAKELRASGDTRTMDQMRADLALDLLVGVNSDGEVADVPVPSFARPIINVTVPIQTLMGIADAPGELSGGTVIPAGLARSIANRPGSTWYRMLTDVHGQMAELSTTSYQPTGPIWRHVVADQTTCFRPGCDVPATASELDHRVPWPEGATNVRNLWPACKADHKAKHTPGFEIEVTDSGHFALRTPTGFAHHVDNESKPTSDEWSEVPSGDDLQFTAAEFHATLSDLRRERRARRPDYVGLWEADPTLLYSYRDEELSEAISA